MNMDGSHLAQMVRSAFTVRGMGPPSRLGAEEANKFGAATGVERMSELLRAPCSDLRSKSAKEQLDSFI
jgi:hypothetical protein